jgi:lysozyme family protein
MTDSIFDIAIQTVLANEGGYTNDANDRGGITNLGITFVDIEHAISKGLIPSGITPLTLSKFQAKIIYKSLYWDKFNISAIDSVKIATKILDSVVVMGNYGIICLQRAFRAIGNYQLEEDGILGPVTVKAVNKTQESLLMSCYRSELAGRFREIIAHNSSQRVFSRGWLSRAYS